MGDILAGPSPECRQNGRRTGSYLYSLIQDSGHLDFPRGAPSSWHTLWLYIIMLVCPPERERERESIKGCTYLYKMAGWTMIVYVLTLYWERVQNKYMRWYKYQSGSNGWVWWHAPSSGQNGECEMKDQIGSAIIDNEALAEAMVLNECAAHMADMWNLIYILVYRCDFELIAYTNHAYVNIIFLGHLRIISSTCIILFINKESIHIPLSLFNHPLY